MEALLEACWPNTFQKAVTIIKQCMMSIKTFGNFSLMYMCKLYCCPWFLHTKAAQKGNFNVAAVGPVHSHDSCTL
jgi:hypothetical protein